MKAKFGAIVVDGRGKAGGHVFSKNRGGSYMRTKVTPSNPQTFAQQSTRSSLTAFAQAFRSLTQAQIAGWNNAVESFKTTNIFGDVKNPSGINLFVRLNTLIALVGGASIDDAPLPSEVGSLTDLSATADVSSTSFDVVFAPTPVPANHAVVIKASRQSSPGVSAFKGKATVITFVAPAGTSPADIYADYIAKYGDLVAGQKVSIEAFIVNKLTGQKSVSLHTTCIITA